MFGTSWKTTLFGYLSGLALLVKNAIAVLDNDATTNLSWEEITLALGMFGLGFSAKDKKVTGGTIQNVVDGTVTK